MQAIVSRRRGFTLIETIVTVGLLAVLAAFVIPTVVQKAQVSDPVKVANDATTIGSALSTFVNDTKANFPGHIYNLTVKPTTSDTQIDTASGVAGTAFTATQVAGWNGPYIGSTIAAAADSNIATGYGGKILNWMQQYDATNNAGRVDGPLLSGGTAWNAANPQFVALKITGLSQAQADAVNALVDGAGDADLIAPNAGANNTGRFRYTVPTAGVVTAYFLAAPIVK